MDTPLTLRDAATAPFWDGLLDSKLKLPKCRTCGHLQFPIGPCCSECLGTDLAWTELSGRGEVWSYIIYHHAFAPEFKDKLPYNVALVRLDEGPRLLTNIVGIAPEELRNGMRVAAQFDRTGPDTALLRFHPDAGA
jgi:uncharacterized OB-fold protein